MIPAAKRPNMVWNAKKWGEWKLFGVNDKALPTGAQQDQDFAC